MSRTWACIRTGWSHCKSASSPQHRAPLTSLWNHAHPFEPRWSTITMIRTIITDQFTMHMGNYQFWCRIFHAWMYDKRDATKAFCFLCSSGGFDSRLFAETYVELLRSIIYMYFIAVGTNIMPLLVVHTYWIEKLCRKICKKRCWRGWKFPSLTNLIICFLSDFRAVRRGPSFQSSQHDNIDVIISI